MVKANAEAVKVVVRCRPMNQKELDDGRKSIVQMNPATGLVQVNNPEPSAGDEGVKKFTFDKVFAPDCTQYAIFEEVAKAQVDACIQGYNATIFAYGQTGTGKTYTMEGKGDKETQGVIPNAFEHIFESLKADMSGREYLVKVSYLEIYNEEVRDMLGKDPKAQLKLREDQSGGTYADGLSKFVASSAADMFKFLEIGRKNRAVGATAMNAGSSRSHSIFTIQVASSEVDERGNELSRVGKLNLVDLAGSERAAKTGATGERFTEGVKINMSLTALGNVISALVDGKKHIPYRDSKLTRLLQDSLGGNSRTVMFAMTGPADWNYDETVSTLRYADRAKRIKNKPTINEDPRDQAIREYQEEIQQLREALAQLKAAGGGDGATAGGKRSAFILPIPLRIPRVTPAPAQQAQGTQSDAATEEAGDAAAGGAGGTKVLKVPIPVPVRIQGQTMQTEAAPEPAPADPALVAKAERADQLSEELVQTAKKADELSSKVADLSHDVLEANRRAEELARGNSDLGAQAEAARERLKATEEALVAAREAMRQARDVAGKAQQEALQLKAEAMALKIAAERAQQVARRAQDVARAAQHVAKKRPPRVRFVEFYHGWSSFQRFWFKLCFTGCMPEITPRRHPMRPPRPADAKRTEEAARYLQSFFAMPEDPNIPDDINDPKKAEQRERRLNASTSVTADRTLDPEADTVPFVWQVFHSM